MSTTLVGMNLNQKLHFCGPTAAPIILLTIYGRLRYCCSRPWLPSIFSLKPTTNGCLCWFPSKPSFSTLVYIVPCTYALSMSVYQSLLSRRIWEALVASFTRYDCPTCSSTPATFPTRCSPFNYQVQLIAPKVSLGVG